MNAAMEWGLVGSLAAFAVWAWVNLAIEKRARRRVEERFEKLEILAIAALTPVPEAEWVGEIKVSEMHADGLRDPVIGASTRRAVRRHGQIGKVVTLFYVSQDLAASAIVNGDGLARWQREYAQRSLDRFVVRKKLGLE